jgi:nucleoside-diphosphate-sugar epimerase
MSEITFLGYGEAVKVLISGSQKSFKRVNIVTDRQVRVDAFQGLNIYSRSEYFNANTNSDLLISSIKDLRPSNDQFLQKVSEVILRPDKSLRLINLSSSAVYGSGLKQMTEGCIPNPQSEYARDKIDLENRLNSTLGSLQVINLRISNLYGSLLLPGLISKLIFATRASGTLSIKKGVFRNFVYFEDLLSFFNLASDKSHPLSPGTYNFAGDYSVSLEQLIDLLRSLDFPLQKFQFIEDQEVLRYSFLDNTKIKKELFMTFTSLHNGLLALKKEIDFC